MVAISDNWDIRYSEYVGDLTLFDKRIGAVDRSELKTDIGDRVAITYDRKTNTPMMVEIREADKVISGINSLSKGEVITKAKEYINA